MNETLQLVNYKDILGKRAYFAKEDRFAGSVKDIMFLLDEKKAVALLLERGLLPLVKPAVLFTDIQDIKNDRILIKSGSSMMSVKELKKATTTAPWAITWGRRFAAKPARNTGAFMTSSLIYTRAPLKQSKPPTALSRTPTTVES